MQDAKTGNEAVRLRLRTPAELREAARGLELMAEGLEQGKLRPLAGAGLFTHNREDGRYTVAITFTASEATRRARRR